MQARITSQITLLTYDDRVLPSFGVGGGGGGGAALTIPGCLILD